MNLSGDSEGILCYLGASPSVPETFLAAVGHGSEWESFGTIVGTGLALGDTALLFGADWDIAEYAASRSDRSAFADYRAAIHNPANWIFEDATDDQSGNGIEPDMPFDATPFTRSGHPIVTITSPAGDLLAVPPTTAIAELAGTCSEVTGSLTWSNALTGASGACAASPTWSVGAIGLAYGTNRIDVTGVSLTGIRGGDTVTIVRQPVTIAIAAPAPAALYDHAVADCILSGSADNAAGRLVWSNGLTGVSGTIPAAAGWRATGVGLAVGENPIRVTATNAQGAATSADVTVTRLAAGLLPGDVALIGWDDTTDAFAFVTLAELPAGTVLHFTDNGWTGSQYRGASPTDGNGNEGLIEFTALAALPAGTIVRSTDTSAAFAWTNSGTIPGTSSAFGNLDLAGGGDQIAVFQGPETNPLDTPGAHVFILDDTGAFEPADSANTGGIAPGLTLGRTALTFNQAGSGENFLAFTNMAVTARTKCAWLAAIADSANWQTGATGTLPSGALTVLPSPPRTVAAEPSEGGGVNVVGHVEPGLTVRLAAQPAAGWMFARWENGDNAALRDYTVSERGAAVTAWFGWKGTTLILR